MLCIDRDTLVYSVLSSPLGIVAAFSVVLLSAAVLAVAFSFVARRRAGVPG